MSDRATIITDLREVLTWLENHSEVPLPYNLTELTIYPSGKEELVEVAHAMGNFKKSSDEHFFHIERTFNSVKVIATEWREKVCTRRQVGTKKIEEKVATAYEVMEKEVPVYEWECPESFLNEDTKK